MWTVEKASELVFDVSSVIKMIMVKRTSILFGILVLIIAFIALGGWYFDIPFFRGLNHDSNSMKMNAVVAFFCCAVVLLIINKSNKNSVDNVIGIMLSVMVFLIAIITLLEYYAEINFSIDELLIKDYDSNKYFGFAGRMAPGTALNFLILSMTLFLKIENKLLSLVQWFAFYLFSVSFFVIICTLYQVRYFTIIEQISLVPLNSSICFLFFSFGISFTNPHIGIVKIMNSSTPLGTSVRILIPMIIIIPIATGLIRLKLEESGFFSTRFGLALYSFVNTIILILISYLGIRKIHSNEQQIIDSEEKIKRSEADLRGIINNTNDMIWSVNRNRDLIKFNNMFNEHLFLLKGKRAHKKMPITDTMIPEQGPLWEAWYERAFSGETFSVECLEEVKNKKRWLEISFNPIIMDLKIKGVAVFCREITEKKLVLEELQKANLELQTFMYKATHDLKAPLASIIGLVNLSHLEIRDKGAIVFLKKIGESTQKLDAILNTLLDTMYVKDSKKYLCKINMPGLVTDLLDSLKDLKDLTKIQITTHFNLKKEFISDKKIIYTILQNLIENAIKYHDQSKTKSWINIEIADWQDGIKIIISDNGIGIKKEFQSKIYDMFYRATENSKGSGLGLYLLRLGVDKLKGSIELTSEELQGSVFTITIPSEI